MQILTILTTILLLYCMIRQYTSKEKGKRHEDIAHYISQIDKFMLHALYSTVICKNTAVCMKQCLAMGN